MEWKVKRIVLSRKENRLKKTYFLTVLFENILIRFYTRNPCCALNELPNYKLSDLESNYIFKAINVFLLPSIWKSSYHHRNTQPNLLVYYWILTHCVLQSSMQIFLVKTKFSGDQQVTHLLNYFLQ